MSVLPEDGVGLMLGAIGTLESDKIVDIAMITQVSGVNDCQADFVI